MPPKKSLEQELGALPDAPTMLVLPLFQTSPALTQALYNRIAQTTFKFQRILNIEKTIELLKQRGVVQQIKKDPKAKPTQQKKQKLSYQQRLIEVQRMLNQNGSESIINNLWQACQDSILLARKQKAEKAEPKDDKKNSKKDTKDSKKNAKVQQEAPKQVVVQPEIPRFHQTFTFLLDLPRDQSEALKMFQCQTRLVDLVLWIKQIDTPNRSKIDISQAEISKNPQGELQQRMKTFSGLQKPPSDRKRQRVSRKDIIKKVYQCRSKSSSSPHSNLIVQQIIVQYDEFNLQETADRFFKKLYILLGQISIKINNYAVWVKSRTVKPYIRDLYPYPAKPVQKKQQQPKAIQKKGAKKQAKKQQKVQQKEVKVQQVKEKLNLKLDYYNQFKNTSNKGPVQDMLINLIANIQFNNLKEKARPLELSKVQAVLKSRSSQESLKLQRLTLPELSSAAASEDQLIKQFKLISSLGLSAQQFQFYKIILQFQKLLKAADPLRHYDLDRRNLLERITLKECEARTQYLIDNGALLGSQSVGQRVKLHAFIFRNPPGRVYSRGWRYKCQALPTLPDFTDYIANSEQQKLKQFFNFDSTKYGVVGQEIQFFQPTDNNILKTCRRLIGSTRQKSSQLLGEHFHLYLRAQADFNVLQGKVGTILQKIKLKKKKDTELQTFIKCNQLTVRIGQTVRVEDAKNKQSIAYYRNGVVRRYLQRGVEQFLFPNGNKVAVKDGVQLQLQISEKTKKQLGSVIVVRSDQTIIVKKDKVRACYFKDGTIIQTENQGETIQIFKKGFPTVRHRTDKIKSLEVNTVGHGSSFAYLGSNNIIQRAVNSKVMQVFFQGGISVHSFYQRRQTEIYQQFEQELVTLISFQDNSIFKASSNGKIKFIGSNQMHCINKVDINNYWVQLFTYSHDLCEGLYQIDLEQGTLRTKDKQLNQFSLSVKEQSKASISVSLNLKGTFQPKRKPCFQEFNIQKENLFLPISQIYPEPRLFVVKEDFCYQLVTRDMIAYTTRLASHCEDHLFFQSKETLEISRVNKVSEKHLIFTVPLSKLLPLPISRFQRPQTNLISKYVEHELLWHRLWLKQSFSGLAFLKEKEVQWRENEDRTRALYEQEMGRVR